MTWVFGELANGGIRICKCGEVTLEDDMHWHEPEPEPIHGHVRYTPGCVICQNQLATAGRRAMGLNEDRTERERAISFIQNERKRLEAVEAELVKAREALVTAAIPLEVLAGQINVKPYNELTSDLQDEIVVAALAVRRAVLKDKA